MSDGGKGSNVRPLFVKREKFDENWIRIFGDRIPTSAIEHMKTTNDYQEVLATEDCALQAVEKFNE